MSNRSSVVTLLINARNLITNNGWCRDALQKEVNGVTHYCAVGALEQAQKEGRFANSTFNAAYGALSNAVGDDIMNYNDFSTANSDRRYVLRAFDRAITTV